MKLEIIILIFIFSCKISIAQDIIFKINGDEIEAKVLEISPDEIKYKIFKFQDGPTYILNKTDVFMIKYPNGQKDVFSNANQKKDDAVATDYVNGGQQQQQQSNFKVVNTSNPDFKVMHNEIIKTTPSNKEQINKLISILEEAILKDDMKKAWEIFEQIKSQN